MYLIDITPQDSRFYESDDLPNEIWKPVVECSTCYVCSNYSRIKTLPRNGVKRGGRILKPSLKDDGYYSVVLQDHGKRFYRRVNRIIAQAFIPNPENKPIADHKDNNPLNNRVDNLQWLTEQENTIKYIKENYDGRYKGRGKILPKKVIATKDDKKIVFDSVFQCSLSIFGIKSKRGSISKACNTGKKYLGWNFEYVKEGD